MKKILFLLLPAAVIALIFLTAGQKGGSALFTPADSKTNQAANEKYFIAVPALCQFPSLPTGCESTAAAMVLQYYGESVSPEEFAADWLEKDEAFYQSDGVLYGPDPNEVFVGDPFSDTGYGCFASAIVTAVNTNSTVCSAEKQAGKTLSDICSEYIDRDQPVLIWVTSSMRPAKSGSSWKLENGEPFIWTAGEHCMVLVGYDDTYYYLNDPQSGSTVCYEKTVVEDRYDELGSQAALIIKK